MADEVFVMVWKETHKQDCYDEDPDSEYGVECHSLRGKTTVHTKEVIGLDALRREVNDLGEANADNPPYDEYHLIVVYEKETKELVPEHWLYDVSKKEASQYEL